MSSQETKRGDFVQFQTDSGAVKTGVVLGQHPENTALLEVLVNPDFRIWTVHYCAAKRLGEAAVVLAETKRR